MRGAFQVPSFVITSYSIHYTKLYELLEDTNNEYHFVFGGGAGTGIKEIDFEREDRITSYNVCYTKLLRFNTGQRVFAEQLLTNILPKDVADSHLSGDLHITHPGIKIGNAFTLDQILNKNLQNIVTDLAIGDFVAFSYSPVDSLNDIVKTPQQAVEDLV